MTPRGENTDNYHGAMLRDRVRDALHIGVKRAMAVVCSGFSFDLEWSLSSFTDISKTDVENEERLHSLIDDAEVPGRGWPSCSSPRYFPLRLAQAQARVVRAVMRTMPASSLGNTPLAKKNRHDVALFYRIGPALGAWAPCIVLC